jgi:hypothetical protein
MMDACALEEPRDDRIHLPRCHRLHEIRADIRAERFHERGVFLALGDHHDVEIGRDLPELAKGIEAAGARHLLVEEHEIESASSQQLGAVGGVGGRFDQEAFVSQEHPMWLEELGLVVDPQHRLPVRCHAEGM